MAEEEIKAVEGRITKKTEAEKRPAGKKVRATN